MTLFLHFINVGKGNCALIDFQSNRLSVIDIDDSRALSKNEREIMTRLKKATVTNPIQYIVSKFPEREIFRFILSHPDMDHMSGIKSLFENKYVRNFWDTKNNRQDPKNWDTVLYDKADWDFYQKLTEESICK